MEYRLLSCKSVTLDGVEYGNYVLTQKGCLNIEFDFAEKKTCGPIYGLEDMIDTFAKGMKENE